MIGNARRILLLVCALVPIRQAAAQSLSTNHVVLAVEPIHAGSAEARPHVALMTDILRTELAQIQFFQVVEPGSALQPDLRFRAELYYNDPAYLLVCAVSDLRAQTERSAFEVRFEADQFYRTLELLIAELNDMAHLLVLPPTEQSIRILLTRDSPIEALSLLRTIQSTGSASPEVVSMVREALADRFIDEALNAEHSGAYEVAGSVLQAALALSEDDEDVTQRLQQLTKGADQDAQQSLSAIRSAARGLLGSSRAARGLVELERFRDQLQDSPNDGADFRVLEDELRSARAAELVESATRARLVRNLVDAQRQYRAAIAIDPLCTPAITGLARVEELLDSRRLETKRTLGVPTTWDFAVRSGFDLSALFVSGAISDPSNRLGGPVRLSGAAIRVRVISCVAGPIHWSFSGTITGLASVGETEGFAIEAAPGVSGHLFFSIVDFSLSVSTPFSVYSRFAESQAAALGGVAVGGSVGVSIFDIFRLEIGYQRCVLDPMSPRWITDSRITLGGSYRHDTH